MIKFELLSQDSKEPLKSGPGYVLYTPHEFVMNSGDLSLIDFGFKCDIPEGFIAMLCGRISPLSRGVDPLEFLDPNGIKIIGPYIGTGYTKSWSVLIKNVSSSIMFFKKHDPICQFVIVKCY